MPDFLPNQVELVVPPLIDTMGQSEIEHAAALIVRVCQVKGNTWQPVGGSSLREVLKADTEAGTQPFASLLRNPFFRPDVWLLVRAGYGRWVSQESGEVELTDKAFEAMSHYVRREPVNAD